MALMAFGPQPVESEDAEVSAGQALARLRVVAVTTWYPAPLAPTAVGVFVRKDCQALGIDHDLTVVHLAPRSSGVTTVLREHDVDLPLVRLPLSPRHPVTTVRSLLALQRLFRGADLVHTMAFSSILPLAIRRPRAPWVHTEHWSGISSPWSLPPRLRRFTRLASASLALPDVVVAVCEFLAVPVSRRRSRPTVVVPCIVEQPVAPFASGTWTPSCASLLSAAWWRTRAHCWRSEPWRG